MTPVLSRHYFFYKWIFEFELKSVSCSRFCILVAWFEAVRWFRRFPSGLHRLNHQSRGVRLVSSNLSPRQAAPTD